MELGIGSSHDKHEDHTRHENHKESDRTSNKTLSHLVAVEHEDLSAEQPAERLDGLRLAGARRPVRVAAQPHVHALGQSQVALVREGRVHQFGGVALVLVGVVKDRVAHADSGTPCKGSGRFIQKSNVETYS